jgi:hypothetical protein
LNALVIRSMVDTALKNAATMAMGGNLNAIGGYCIVYELQSQV